MLDAGYWMFDAGYWMLDAGYWMLDTGYWILDAGYWMFDACLPLEVAMFISSHKTWFSGPVIDPVFLYGGRRQLAMP